MDKLESFVANYRDKTICIAAQDLEGTQQFMNCADAPLHPASTIKVHVMIEVFHQAQQGRLALDDRLTILNRFTSIADGSDFALDAHDDSETTLYRRLGENETLRELTRLMIVRSSNLATNLLIGKVGTEDLNTFIAELGIDGVQVRRGVEDGAAFRMGINNSATARGLAKTMRLLARGEVVSADASNQMIDILLGQEFNESIPARLPSSARVAHKTGWTGTFYHDCGIVYPQGRKPYAISIMTNGFPEDDEKPAHACMAEISRIIYDQMP